MLTIWYNRGINLIKGANMKESEKLRKENDKLQKQIEQQLKEINELINTIKER